VVSRVEFKVEGAREIEAALTLLGGGIASHAAAALSRRADLAWGSFDRLVV
jgi:hypothetical protein